MVNRELTALTAPGFHTRLPRLWQHWRSVLALSLLVNLLWQGMQFVQGDLLTSPLPLLLTLFDLLALIWLQSSRRCRDCFLPEHHLH